MIILAIIMILVGIVLWIVGRNITRYLPPNYDGGDDGFLELMKTTGGFIQIIGVGFLVAGIVMFILFR